MYNLQTFNLFVLDIKCWLVPDVKVHKSCIPTQKILFLNLLTCSSRSKDLGESMYKPLQNVISNKWVELLEHYTGALNQNLLLSFFCMALLWLSC